jgi:LytS/YehU family sensor histidine kinase
VAVDVVEHAKSCALTNRQAISLAMDSNQPSIYICHAGLVNIEIPLIVEGQHVGAITAGQVRTSEPDSYPRDTTPCAGNWMEDPELVEYYKEIKTLSKQQIEATTQALANISNYIIQRYAFNKMQEELLRRQHELLAYSLSNLQSTVPLEKELACIKNYLSIQKIRFDDRLSFSISCDKSMRSLHVPFFALQPLVENSLEHGLLNVAAGGSVRIDASQDDGGYFIDIIDDGIGIEPDVLRSLQDSMCTSEPGLGGSSVGLFNSYNRFRLLYGDAFAMSIDSHPGEGTAIRIRISPSDAELATT